MAHQPSPRRRRVDADADARLRSLGYVVSSTAPPRKTYGSADDPKTLVHLNRALDEAAASWARGDAEAAVRTLRGIIAERRDFMVAYDRLGYVLRATGRIGEAVQVLDEAARGGHADRAILRSLGAALRDAGDLKRSAMVLGGSGAAAMRPICRRPTSSASRWHSLGTAAEAERQFRRVLAASPNAAETWNNLGSLFLASEALWRMRQTALSRAVAINPDLAERPQRPRRRPGGAGPDGARGCRMDAARWRCAPAIADAQYNLDRARK